VDAPIAIERAADGLMVDADGVGDGADRPVLGVKEAADLSALEQGLDAHEKRQGCAHQK